MIRRLYVHNYRCLENFDLPIADKSSALLIGKNGSGKTTVGFALEILQRIARGTNRVGELVKPMDLVRSRVPMRFEIEVSFGSQVYEYAIAFDYPEGFRELRVKEEKLLVNGKPVYTRHEAQVHVAKTGQNNDAQFRIDWHLVALPIVQPQSDPNSHYIFKQWLANMLIVRPIPILIRGDSEEPTLQPTPAMTDLAAWFTGLFRSEPARYATIDSYLKQLMPDFKEIKNVEVGTNFRRLLIHFSNSERGRLTLPLDNLSDGEKCFMIGAMVLAAKDTFGELFCFWDEPDNYLALDEVGHFVLSLRREGQSGSQFIATSHNQEAISRFSDENTFYLYRNSHLEPTIVRSVSDLRASGGLHGDLVSALVRGDVKSPDQSSHERQ